MEYGKQILAAELLALKDELQTNLRSGEWNGIAGTLDQLAALGETEGHRELSLRAQSLRELMGERGGGRTEPGARMQELFDDLFFHLSHLHWRNQASQ